MIKNLNRPFSEPSLPSLSPSLTIFMCCSVLKVACLRLHNCRDILAQFHQIKYIVFTVRIPQTRLKCTELTALSQVLDTILNIVCKCSPWPRGSSTASSHSPKTCSPPPQLHFFLPPLLIYFSWLRPYWSYIRSPFYDAWNKSLYRYLDLSIIICSIICFLKASFWWSNPQLA